MEKEVQNQNKEENIQEEKSVKNSSLFSSKRYLTIIGIIIVALIAFVLILFAVSNPRYSTTQTPSPTPIIDKPFGSIMLSPANISAVPNQKTTVDILLNTGGTPIAGAIIAIKYNPLLLSNVTLTQFKDPHSAVSTALDQIAPVQTNTTDGYAILTLKLPTTIPSLNGFGKVAEVSFVPKRVNIAISDTSISLIPITAFLRPNQGEHTALTRNEVKVMLKP